MSAKSKEIKAFNLKKIRDILNKEPYDDDEDYDTLEYFLKKRQFIPSSFEDGVTKGGNIAEYGRYAGLDDIGKIQLSNGTLKFAKPENYIFSGVELGAKKYNKSFGVH